MQKESHQKSLAWEGEAQVTISSGEFVANFGTKMRFTTGDSLHIHVTGPFGMDIAEVYIIGHRYLYLNHMDRHVLNGENDDEVLERIFEIPLSPYLLSRLLLFPSYFISGKLETMVWPYRLMNVEQEGNQLRTMELQRNNHLIRIEYDQFHSVKGMIFPYQAKIHDRNENKHLLMTFKKIRYVEGGFQDVPLVPLSYKQLTL